MTFSRFASAALLVALALPGPLTAAGCHSTEKGGSAATAGGGTAATADVDLPGIDTSAMTPRERREWSQSVSELLAPCADTPVSVAQCVREKRACSRCVPAAKYLVKLTLQSGGTREQIVDRYHKRFDADKLRNIDTSDTPSKGAAGAPVTIVEWADFQCPFCKRAAPIFDELAEKKFPGKVRLFFKNYPLSMHPLAERAARAGIAALDQRKFWEMHHVLYEESPALEPEAIEKNAKDLGLNLAQFKADMDSEKTGAMLARDKKQADSLDLQGTPFIFINGREFPLAAVVDFATDLEEWVRMELELNGAPSAPVTKTPTPVVSAPK